MNIQRIQDALAYGDGAYSVGNIVDGILDGSMFYLENDGSTLVFEVIEYPQVKRLHILLLAGDLETGHELREEAEELAKSIGATEVSLCGRKGWQRVLGEHGYNSGYQLLVKSL